MLSLIIAESSIELVPEEIKRHPSVRASARRSGKKPSQILLDNSWHFAAMRGLENEIKRGRPDLVHFSLLEATSIPLYFEDKVQIYVHTVRDQVIFVGSGVRLPKSFHRFAGLMEKLFYDGIVKSEDKTLLELKKMSFSSLIDSIDPKKVVGLSTDGTRSTYSDVASGLDDSCLVLGGFQKGEFSAGIKDSIDESFCVDDESLESHIVLGRILYEYEKTIFM